MPEQAPVGDQSGKPVASSRTRSTRTRSNPKRSDVGRDEQRGPALAGLGTDTVNVTVQLPNSSPVSGPVWGRVGGAGSEYSRGGHDLGARRSEVTLELPVTAPLLTPGLVRVLARILTKAGRARSVRVIRDADESEALAS